MSFDAVELAYQIAEKQLAFLKEPAIVSMRGTKYIVQNAGRGNIKLVKCNGGKK